MPREAPLIAYSTYLIVLPCSSVIKTTCLITVLLASRPDDRTSAAADPAMPGRAQHRWVNLFGAWYYSLAAWRFNCATAPRIDRGLTAPG
jgi:hypothetical protein